MIIKWLKTALKNLDNEAEYIALENPQAAKSIVKKIILTVNILRENPALGKAGRIVGTRELVIANTPYLIPYRIKNNTIEILRVFHCSRKPPKN